MIPYRSEQPHDCGGTIHEGATVTSSWLTHAGEKVTERRGPFFWKCERCGAFRWEDAPGFFPSGTDAKANRDAWDNGDLRSPDAPDDAGDDAEREPWPPVDDRPEHAPQPDDAPEDCDQPDPDYDGPMVPMGGAS